MKQKNFSSSSKFGSKIPFSEPAWYRGYFSPYFNDSHKQFREKVRSFVDKELAPFADEWEEGKDYPRELHEKAYKAGVYGANWPVEYGGTPPPDYDIFHELIYWDELARCGSGGICAAVFLTIAIALPPIIVEGSDQMKARIAADVINGKKIIALALTEPGVGSDLANLETTAVREGDYYVINGSKKFITSGMKADYFVVAVRTGTKGMAGVSLVLVESKTPGIKLTRLSTQGWYPSNTALIVFEDVRVPISNVIGEENQGFKAIMVNFNHERWIGIIMSVRACRLALEDSIKYARERKTFGKKLIEHQVIRHKLAEMIIKIEAIQSHLENLTYQMKCGASPLEIGANIAFLKVYTTKTMEYCAREASQIFGGNSYLKSGRGAGIERLYREVRVSAIGGGSEEVMTDLGLRLSKL